MIHEIHEPDINFAVVFQFSQRAVAASHKSEKYFFNMLTGLYLSRPVVYSGISVRYLFKSIPPINLSNVKTGSSRSKQSERNSGKYPCFELQ